MPPSFPNALQVEQDETHWPFELGIVVSYVQNRAPTSHPAHVRATHLFPQHAPGQLSALQAAASPPSPAEPSIDTASVLGAASSGCFTSSTGTVPSADPSDWGESSTDASIDASLRTDAEPPTPKLQAATPKPTSPPLRQSAEAKLRMRIIPMIREFVQPRMGRGAGEKPARALSATSALSSLGTSERI